MCEFAAGLCGSGWRHSQEWLCYLKRTTGDEHKNFWAARLSMCEFAAGLCEAGGCTPISGCATLAEDGGAAGPGPVLGMSGQACLDGIVLDVGADGVELFGRADPMVERLVLPEMFLLQGED
jgi:hypothetical protein